MTKFITLKPASGWAAAALALALLQGCATGPAANPADPAEKTVVIAAASILACSKTSAIGLRHVLPVQTNRIFFILLSPRFASKSFAVFLFYHKYSLLKNFFKRGYCENRWPYAGGS